MPGPQCGITPLAFNCGIMHRMQVLVYVPCMLARVRFQIGVRADFEGYMYEEGVVNVPAYSERRKKIGYLDQIQPPLTWAGGEIVTHTQRASASANLLIYSLIM